MSDLCDWLSRVPGPATMRVNSQPASFVKPILAPKQIPATSNPALKPSSGLRLSTKQVQVSRPHHNRITTA